MSNYAVYLLRSQTTTRTYVGCTNNIERRLRQHNGEIKGGAKYTKYGRPWELVCMLKGFPDKTSAYQFEWRMHHPPKYLKPKRRCYGVDGRMKCMNGILKLEKFTKNAKPTSEMNLYIVS